MKLTDKQLEEIKALSNTVIEKRKYVLISLCEILGDDWYVIQEGRTSSQALVNEKTHEVLFIKTYRFANPTAYAIKDIFNHSEKIFYHFDYYGNLIK